MGKYWLYFEGQVSIQWIIHGSVLFLAHFEFGMDEPLYTVESESKQTGSCYEFAWCSRNLINETLPYYCKDEMMIK